MCERQTFSIDFIARKLKGEKSKANIFAKVTVDGETTEISTKDLIKFSSWDSRQERVKGRNIEASAINNHINEVRFRLQQKYRELEKQEEIITAQTVKDAYLDVQKKLKQHRLFELTKYFKQIWESKIFFIERTAGNENAYGHKRNVLLLNNSALFKSIGQSLLCLLEIF